MLLKIALGEDQSGCGLKVDQIGSGLFVHVCQGGMLVLSQRFPDELERDCLGHFGIDRSLLLTIPSKFQVPERDQGGPTVRPQADLREGPASEPAHGAVHLSRPFLGIDGCRHPSQQDPLQRTNGRKPTDGRRAGAERERGRACEGRVYRWLVRNFFLYVVFALLCFLAFFRLFISSPRRHTAKQSADVSEPVSRRAAASV